MNTWLRWAFYAVCMAGLACMCVAAAPQSFENAILNGDLPRLAALLHDDPSLANARNDRGETPLLVAAGSIISEHTEVVQFLLRSGAEVNARNILGQTALHYAATRGYLEIARLLLAQGADPNLRDVHGASPVNYTLAHGHRKTAEFLLAHGARADAFDAVTLGKLDLLRDMLADNPSLSNGRAGPWHRPLLEVAAAARQSQAASLLLAYGARLDIFLASALGRLNDVESFLERNPALLNARDETHQSPLDWAIRGGQRDVAEFLLARGAALTASGRALTPLSVAAEAGDAEMVKLLLSHGAGKDPSERIEALKLAMALHHNEAVMLLR